MTECLFVEKTTHLSGRVTPPSSKSQSIRGILLALLAEGETVLENPLYSEDTHAALAVCTQLGCTISTTQTGWLVKSPGLPLPSNTKKIFSGNSGITTRFILPILGLRKQHNVPLVLDCGEQMRARPMRSLIEALRVIGLNIAYVHQTEQLPISIAGQLTGGVAEVEGITSQYISALLLALPCAPKDSEITVRHLHERPYMAMTLDWLRKQNIGFEHTVLQDKDVFTIPGNQRYLPFHTVIPGDFSSASYLIAAAVLMAGKVEILGLHMQDTQGDKRLIPILQAMGAKIGITPEKITIQGGGALTGMAIDANDIPDLLPTLAVIGTVATGKTSIRNVPQARLKETDRIQSMTTGLRRLGARVEEYPDGLVVYQSKLQGALVKGYADHRTVMALAIAGMLAEGQTVIEDGEAIHKTFPTFIEMMRELGANI